MISSSKKPILPLSAYLRFYQDEYPKLNGSNMSLPEKAKFIGGLWRNLEKSIKDKYLQEYHDEMKIFNLELGNDDKST